MSKDNEYLIDYKPYMGNHQLKRDGIAIEWNSELIKEYAKCAQDCIYFIKNYMKIINVDNGLISFIPYDYQEDMLNSMTNNRFTIIATARQAGKTSSIVGYILWYILFHDDKTVALLANKGDTAREILGRVQLAYQYLPKWLQQGVLQGGWNKGSISLENNSRVIASSSSDNNIRGYSINLLIIDEAAHIDNWNEFFTAVYPVISSGKSTKVVLISTPNGMNEFYSLWMKAEQRENEYNPIKVTWNQVPGRDENWYKTTLAGLNDDLDRFNQEFNVEFLGSSGTLISGWKLKELVAKKPITQKNNLLQYSLPEKNKRYALTVDVSHGKGLDYSAFSVFDITKMPYVQVCMFSDNLITPADYSDLIHRIAKTYNNAMVLIEVNDLGSQIAEYIHNDLEYENLLWTQNYGSRGRLISFGFNKGAEKGLRMSKKIKLIGCSMLKLLIEQNQLIINDRKTISELSTFSRKGVSYEAEVGKHDDLVMSLVLFAWLTDQTYFKEYTDINTLTELRELSEDELMEDLAPFGFIMNGIETEHGSYDELKDMTTAWMKWDEDL